MVATSSNSNVQSGGPFTRNESFDPFTQEFKLLLPDGRTAFTTPLSVVQMFMAGVAHRAIIQAIQVGVGAMLLLVLILMTKKEKRRSIIFILNTSALTLVVIRSGLELGIITGQYYNFYRWLTHWYVDLGDAPLVSIWGEVITVLLTMNIEFALVLQVHIVCCTLTSLQRFFIVGLNASVAVVASACFCAICILNIRWSILGAETESKFQFSTVSRLAKLAYIMISASIGLSSLILSTKLAFAIRERRSLGMKQFGPMQIIFVMGCQTMIIPFIFTLISYFALPGVGMQTFVQTSVAILLPLSGMWAGTNTNKNNNVRALNIVDRTTPQEYGEAGRPQGKHNTGSDRTTSTLTYVDGEKRIVKKPDSYDLEMQNLDGVYVDRSYSVNSTPLRDGGIGTGNTRR